MKLKELVNSQAALIELLKEQLPINIAWELNRLVKKLEPELKVYEDLRVEKIKQYGQPIGDTEQLEVKEENREVFFKELSELQDQEVTVEFTKIKMSEFVEYSRKAKEPITITTNNMLLLDWIFEE